MAAVTVTVDATWRMSRVEMMLPHGLPQSIVGYGEVLLQESPGAEAAILRRRATSMTDAENGPVTYGSMPSDTVSRPVTPELLAETIGEVTRSDTLQVLAMFFEKWREEDANAPPPAPLPQGVPLTPMHAQPMVPEIDAPPPPNR